MRAQTSSVFISLLAITYIVSGRSMKVQHLHNLNELDSSRKEFQYQPRHVHISYGDKPTEIFVTWSTVDKPTSRATSVVEYGRGYGFHQRSAGSATLFEDPGSLHLKQYIHRVTLSNLDLGATYSYHCGSDDGWSEVFFFTTMKNGTDWSPKFAVYGDLGNENAQSLARLQLEVQNGMYDAIIHVGDMAYNMETDNGRVGDSFMDQLEPVAAYLPYMTCPGNHESFANFTHYRNRFTMPMQEYEGIFYSWNIGPIHFISISTEVYYYLEYGLKPVVTQYEWLVADLKEASKPENRKLRPWIIVYGHRPMYCSNEDDACTSDNPSRTGLPYLHWFPLEDLLMQHGVDLTIWAHEHSYERLWPIYNNTVYNGSLAEPYKNPKAMVHVITGSAGCNGGHDPFPHRPRPAWSAFRNPDYGYSRLNVLNNTHLYMEQVSDDQKGKVIDSFYLIREQHTPYKIPPT